jgi:hypothetical protein
MREITHPRTPEAKAKCRFGPGSCHDCAMTCPHGNTIRDNRGRHVVCGSDVFNDDGTLRICGQCHMDHIEDVAAAEVEP